MPRSRVLSRVEHIARSLEALESAEESLQAIDLRRCPSELREAIKNGRAHTAEALECARAALHYEVTHVPRPSIAPE